MWIVKLQLILRDHYVHMLCCDACMCSPIKLHISYPAIWSPGPLCSVNCLCVLVMTPEYCCVLHDRWHTPWSYARNDTQMCVCIDRRWYGGTPWSYVLVTSWDGGTRDTVSVLRQLQTTLILVITSLARYKTSFLLLQWLAWKLIKFRVLKVLGFKGVSV